MKNGISSIPKHCLLVLLGDMLKLIQRTGSTLISDSLSNKEKIRKLEEFFLSKDTALLYMASNKVIDSINEDKDEMNNVSAEMQLHLDAYESSYEDMFNQMATVEIDTMLGKFGMYRDIDKDDSEESDE